jgi:hypothetical protein
MSVVSLLAISGDGGVATRLCGLGNKAHTSYHMTITPGHPTPPEDPTQRSSIQDNG